MKCPETYAKFLDKWYALIPVMFMIYTILSILQYLFIDVKISDKTDFIFNILAFAFPSAYYLCSWAIHYNANRITQPPNNSASITKPPNNSASISNIASISNTVSSSNRVSPFNTASSSDIDVTLKNSY